MTRLEGTLVVLTPAGPLEIRTLFDTGSEADAVSFDKAIELKQQGVGWGESGGSLVVASGGEVQPAGSLRLLLTAEPGKVSLENQFKIPRSLTFCTDVEIVNNLTSELIIGYSTLVGTGLLGVILGEENFEPEDDLDADGFEDLWPDIDQNEFTMPKLEGSPEEQRELRNLCLEFKDVFGPLPYGGSNLPPCNGH